MTEKQKRDNEELYYAGKDSDFLDEVIRAKNLCYEYNQLPPMDLIRYRCWQHRDEGYPGRLRSRR